MNMPTQPNVLEKITRRLQVDVPPLPRTVRYIDDYTDCDHSVSDPAALNWKVFNNGAKANVKFERYGLDFKLQCLIQAFAADYLCRGSVPTTKLYIDSLANIPTDDIVELIECEPNDARNLWDAIRAKVRRSDPLTGLKALLKFVAERSVGRWKPAYIKFISSSLPLPSRDKYSAVRSGEVFIGIEDESALVRWINDRTASTATLSLAQLVATALLVCSYQFAMRPKQIGLLRRRDCNVIANATGQQSVHLSFRMIKQRAESNKRMPLVRKVKQEWSNIFISILRQTDDAEGSAHLLGYSDAASISVRIRELLLEVTNEEWTATDLRHSGAMRLVDAGASAEELAEFMGHSSLETGLVYYDSSATQAERINEALGISETYRHVIKFASPGFISADKLRSLKGDKQIAGVPHGIPIAGIGACKTGQPSCPFNPVTACYGCPKFIPVADLTVHLGALKSFREVINFFYASSRGESSSPAYLQLKQTLAEIQSVITELETANVKQPT